jgi:ABC-2 type transport system permease protein
VTPVLTTARVGGRALLIGFADFRADYSVVSWLGGWALRLVFQVAFFAGAGVLLGDHAVVRYLAVGNVIAVGIIESATPVLMLGWERLSGRLALLVAAPGNHVTALFARQGSAPVQGLLSSSVVFLVVWPVFGLRLPGLATLWLVPLAFATFVAVYCYGFFAGVLMIRHPSAGWASLNVSYLLLMVFCGVNVDPGFWPAPVTAATQLLPVTHGLAACRAVLNGAPVLRTLPQLGLEALVAAGWLAAGAVLLRRRLAAERRAGTLDFGR